MASRRDALYPAIKRLTLDLAAISFLGVDLGAGSRRAQPRLFDMVAASIAVIRSSACRARRWRAAWPGAALIVDYFRNKFQHAATAEARIFSHICAAPPTKTAPCWRPGYRRPCEFFDDGGARTLTSALTSFLYRLAAEPDWQGRFATKSTG